MTAARPRIIVSLPARHLSEVRSELERAAAGGADVAELRIDRLAPGERSRTSELFPTPVPLLATLRSRAEGGEGPDDPAERAQLLGRLAREGFRWIDLEVDRDLPEPAGIPPAPQVGRILSVHRLRPISDEEWPRLVGRTVPEGAYLKIVAPAGVLETLTLWLPTLSAAHPPSVVAMTTGPSGPLLRALAGRLGAPIVFAALPEAGSRSPSPVEPGQLPVDRLRPFLDSPGGPIFAVVGHPVAHSRSPALHHRWMRSHGHAGLYVALDIPTGAELVAALRPLAAWGFRGVNVTHPLKSAAFGAATALSEGARASGVANCLTLSGDRIVAENTDLGAVRRRLTELRAEGRWDGARLAVVGTGGAARATLAAARSLGAIASVYGRHPGRTRALAEEFDARSGRPDGAVAEQLVVHATSVGRTDTGSLELPLEGLLRAGSHVLDWVYDPVQSEVRERARRAGATYEDGRRLLVYQAAASYEVWWGEAPDATEIARTLEEEGCTA